MFIRKKTTSKQAAKRARKILIDSIEDDKPFIVVELDDVSRRQLFLIIFTKRVVQGMTAGAVKG